MELSPDRLIQDNVIKAVRFTQTEIKILSCFSVHITKSKSIGTILGSSPKTIDTHIDNIKRKINITNKEDIYLFIRSSSEFSQLIIIFNQIYIDHKYKQAAKKIAYQLKASSVICNLNVSTELEANIGIDEISKAIRLTGIKINSIDNLSLLQIDSSDLASNQFFLIVVKTADEIKNLQKCINFPNQKVIYVCLNKTKEEEPFEDNILFYDGSDNKSFYLFLLNFLIKTYKIFDKEEEISTFLSSLDNDIESEIEETENGKKNIFENQGNFKSNANFFSKIVNKKLAIATALLILVGVYMFNHGISIKPQKKIVNIGTSNLKRSDISEVLVYNLPPININFTGRSNDFVNIKDNFLKKNIGLSIQAIVGAGGIGKTQLITEYAYRAINNKEYDAVLWFTSDSLNKINDTYIDLADRLNINIDNLNSVAIKKAIHNELLEKYKIKKILFVLDNVSKEEEIEPFLTELRGQWPIGSNIHILISTRNQHFSCPSFILDVFTPDEALLFMQRHLTDANEQDILKLIGVLHYYPLALEQAVGYIKQHTNIADYIEMYNDKTQQHLNHFSGNFNEYQETLWKTLSLSLSKLSNNAKEMLYILSYFEPNCIQLNFFNQFTVEQRSKAIKELREHSFIILSQNMQSFKIHVLLQEMIRLIIKDKNIWINKTMTLANKGASLFDAKDKTTWDSARNWLYHVNSIYKNISSPNALETAGFLDKYSRIARHFGLYNLTHELLENSLHIKEQYYKNINDIGLIDTLDNLGSIELALDHYDKAKNLYKRILKIQEIHYKKSDHIKLSGTLNNIGSVEMLQGNYDEARKFYQQALKIKEDYYQTAQHIELTDTLEGLGMVEYYFGNIDKAKKLWQKVLKLKENYYQSVEHIDLANLLSRIGCIEFYLNCYEEAKKLQEKALEIYYKNHKEANNILAVDFLQRLAIAEWGLGNFDRAINLYKKVLQIKQDHYQNPNHIDTAITLQGLGLTEFSKGNYIEAKKFLEKDLKIRISHYQSEEHFKLVSTYHTLGLCEEGLGNYDVALSYISKAYTIGNRFFKEWLQKNMAGDYSPSIPWPNLTQKNREKAIAYYKKSLQITKNLFGEDHHMIARHYYLLGQAYELNKQNNHSTIQYKKALEIAQQAALYMEGNVLANHQKNMDKLKHKLPLVSH